MRERFISIGDGSHALRQSCLAERFFSQARGCWVIFDEENIKLLRRFDRVWPSFWHIRLSLGWWDSPISCGYSATIRDAVRRYCGSPEPAPALWVLRC